MFYPNPGLVRPSISSCCWMPLRGTTFVSPWEWSPTDLINSVAALTRSVDWYLTFHKMSRGSRTDVVAARATSYHRDTSGLPSSTVVSIGGGFVAFALSILAILTSVRAFRLLFEAKRKSRNGEPTTFAQLWEREGGFWGFITGLGGESSAGGAGFIDVGRQRRWEEMLRRERWMIDLMDIEGDVGETPRLWEVPVEEKEAIEEDEVEVEQCHVGLYISCPEPFAEVFPIALISLYISAARPGRRDPHQRDNRSNT